MEHLEDWKQYFLFDQVLYWHLKLDYYSFHFVGLDSIVVKSLDCLGSNSALTMVRTGLLNP
jgi:hypothetical protein